MEYAGLNKFAPGAKNAAMYDGLGAISESTARPVPSAAAQKWFQHPIYCYANRVDPNIHFGGHDKIRTFSCKRKKKPEW